MYAETFNVRAWLEDPAKWLRWSMQSLGARNLKDARYNLEQFWKSIPAFKAKASSQQDWSEILTLDAQSKWALGTLYGHEAGDVLSQINSYQRARNLAIYATPLAAISAMTTGAVDLPMLALKSKLESLHQGAAKAFQEQVDLAGQAARAAQAAGVTSQAGNTLTVGINSGKRAADDAAANRSQADRMGQMPNFMDDLKKGLEESIFGIPLWAWLAGGTALLLLITTAPAMAQGYAVRRALED